MKTSDVHCPHLRCLRPVLERWIKLNGQLAERWYEEPDCPWWYKERALLGTFCGSLWLSYPHSVALEEYSDSKTVVDSSQLPRKTYTGRVDLYFEVGNQRFVAESKHVWVAATSQNSQWNKIENCIRRASKEIRQTKPGSGFRRLAIVFAAPYIRMKGKSPLAQRELRVLKDGVLWSVEQARKTNYDAMAWAFPGLGKYGKYKDVFHPGVIMLLKEVK